jgi:RimJ/RimL family protein N-acetyltransferase
MNALNHKFPVYLKGEFIILHKAITNDAQFIYELRSSPAAQYLNCPPDYSLESQTRWLLARPDTEINYIISDWNGNRVGMVSIYDCDWANGVSNVGRLLLSEALVHQGTPYGLEALKITYGYVFDVMGFRKISGTINSKNEKVIHLQGYLGMCQEGYFKDHVLLNGEPQDLVFLSLTKEHFPYYCSQIDKLLDKFCVAE